MIQMTRAVRKLSETIHAFVRAPDTANSLIEHLASAARGRQRNMVAATKDSLAVAARGHAVLRLQHDCQTAAATAAVFAQLQQSRNPVQQEPGHMDMNDISGARMQCHSQSGSSIEVCRLSLIHI